MRSCHSSDHCVRAASTRRPMPVEEEEDNVDDRHLRRRLHLSVVIPADKTAYVTTLWGTCRAHFIDALVCGRSLNKNTKRDMILLYTEDVSPDWLRELGTYWQCEKVSPVVPQMFPGVTELVNHNSRFDLVFTKLRAWDHLASRYERIIMLDTDIVIRKNIDELFQQPTPMALQRHPGADFAHGAPISELGGINAGVMVVQPSKDDWERMSQILKKPQKCKGLKQESNSNWEWNKQPEQNFLSVMLEDWSHLEVKYNYQLHQMSYLDRECLKMCRRSEIELEDVHVWHFSALPKPSHFVVGHERKPETGHPWEDSNDWGAEMAEHLMASMHLPRENANSPQTRTIKRRLDRYVKQAVSEYASLIKELKDVHGRSLQTLINKELKMRSVNPSSCRSRFEGKLVCKGKSKGRDKAKTPIKDKRKCVVKGK